MAIQVFAFTATIPAGTPITAPVTVELAMPAAIVQTVELRVPPGPRGLMGFALGAAGVAVLPYGPGTWFVTDDEPISWPLVGQISSGGWELYGYNTGQFAHSIYLRFLTVPVTSLAAAVPSLIASAALEPAPSPAAPVAAPVPVAAPPGGGLGSTLVPG